MTTLHTLTGDLPALLGGDIRNPLVTIESNVVAPDALVDFDNAKTYPPGPDRVPLNAGATFAIQLIDTGGEGTNMSDGSLRWTLSVAYSDAAGIRRTWSCRNFVITADTDLSAVVPTADPPATAANQYIAEMEALLAQAEEAVGLTGEDAAVAALLANSNSASRAALARLVQWAKTPDTLITGAITRNSASVVTSAQVVWPDGATGVFTTTDIGPMDTIDAYTITYDDGVTDLTFTQPAITRDVNGAATNIPGMVVS